MRQGHIVILFIINYYYYHYRRHHYRHSHRHLHYHPCRRHSTEDIAVIFILEQEERTREFNLLSFFFFTLELRGTFEQGFKDGAYYCYCAYVLRISRYSDFLSPLLTNTGIFLRGLKLSGETRS